MDARVIWRRLNGIICLYKPAGINVRRVRQQLLERLVSELNQIKAPSTRSRVLISGNVEDSLTVTTVPDFAADPLVVGPSYVPDDFRCAWATYMGRDSSGILVMGLNNDTSVARKFHMSRQTRTFHISGNLGYATDTYFSDGKIVEKATFDHIKRSSLDRILSKMQAAHQKHMFVQCGLDIQSQAAYDLATVGLIRPLNNTVPILYNIRCIHFRAPEFIIEVTSINDTEQYLKTLIHEIGLQLKTCATCISIQCIRHGNFTLDHALLRKDWNLTPILNNLVICTPLVQENMSKMQAALMKQNV